MAQEHEHDDEDAMDEAGGDQAVGVEEGAEEGGEDQPKLDLEVKIDDRSACERHITVTVPARTSIAISTRSSAS